MRVIMFLMLLSALHANEVKIRKKRTKQKRKHCDHVTFDNSSYSYKGSARICQLITGGIVNGQNCANPIVVGGAFCIASGDPEGQICANDGQPNEAYCSYDVGPNACAFCGPAVPPACIDTKTGENASFLFINQSYPFFTLVSDADAQPKPEKTYSSCVQAGSMAVCTGADNDGAGPLSTLSHYKTDAKCKVTSFQLVLRGLSTLDATVVVTGLFKAQLNKNSYGSYGNDYHSKKKSYGSHSNHPSKSYDGDNRKKSYGGGSSDNKKITHKKITHIRYGGGSSHSKRNSYGGGSSNSN